MRPASLPEPPTHPDDPDTAPPTQPLLQCPRGSGLCPLSSLYKLRFESFLPSKVGQAVLGGRMVHRLHFLKNSS